MKKLLLLFNTVKYLKWQQIYYRILRKVKKHPQINTVDVKFPCRAKSWLHHNLYDEKITVGYVAKFLNEEKKLNFPDDWDKESPSKLWVYNLHYFEDLLSFNADEKVEFHVQLLKRWIQDNPIGFGNAWEPYPTSLRVSNTLKAWLGGLELPKDVLENIYNQAQYLSQDLEKHLLGNHYFVNLKALLFAGVLFKQSDFKSIAEQGLLAEIPEQILLDGANFELSPMYHNLILVDMLDMYNLAQAYPDDVSTSLLQLLKDKIPLMLDFMSHMSHPDGEVSFFNDSAFGIAPSNEVINEYAKKLGFSTCELTLDENRFVESSDSGYLVAQINRSKLIFDAAKVGPDYIPGHAHADTLSLEFSVGIERVLVNSGTSVYGLSLERLAQRKTVSHNTVEIDGKDSSQVWSGFRVANRARVTHREMKRISSTNVVFSACHDGYKKLFGGCTHTRTINFDENKLTITDKLSGRFKKAVVRFYFHPNLDVKLVNNQLIIKGKDFEMAAIISGGARLKSSQWYPEFGKAIQNNMLEVPFEHNTNMIEFKW